LVLAIPLLLAWPLAAWAAAQALIKTASLERADALVVFSGSSAYVERVRRAAELYHQGRAPRIFLMNDGVRGGWSEAQQTNPLFVERAQEQLVRSGVPKANIEVLPGNMAGTHDEAIAALHYARQNNLRSLLFVTSAYHTRRALWTLRVVFRDSNVTIGIEGVEPGQQLPTPATWWWHRRGWRAVALEYPKLVYYYWQYR
jgi:uncharacterized SAM-binding protein YcdF (DUF218 family)